LNYKGTRSYHYMIKTTITVLYYRRI